MNGNSKINLGARCPLREGPKDLEVSDPPLFPPENHVVLLKSPTHPTQETKNWLVP